VFYGHNFQAVVRQHFGKPCQPAMFQPLCGKVALVTGGARGIGRAIALKLASAGCDVAINYYSSHQDASALCHEIAKMGRRSIAIQGSVADPDSVKEIFQTFRESFEHLDVLVSNAASGVLKPTMAMNRKHWRWCMETNALAVLLTAQQAVDLMPNGGRILALSSIGASRAIPEYGFVGASKAAVESLVRSLAQELGPRGIRVNTISSGVVDTDALAYFPNRESLLNSFAERNPTQQVLLPQHVADAAYLLCLPESDMINGHTLVVDGGFAISG
jgi:enoyl-[acyl-carrier protein] reductase III